MDKISPDEIKPDVYVIPPRGIALKYEINDYMDEDKEIDPVRAGRQWNNYVQTLRETGIDVEILFSRHEEFMNGEWPDIVFAANHGYSFSDGDKRKVLLSNLECEERSGEVEIVREMLEDRGIETVGPTEHVFEGEGDIVDHPEEGKVWAAYGDRTEKEAHEEFEEITGLETVPIELKNECYHLDTCLSDINGEIAIAYANGMENYSKIEETYDSVIEVPHGEGRNLAANAYNHENTVIMNKGNPETASQLQELGFNVKTIELDQLMLLGGSASCMKLEV